MEMSRKKRRRRRLLLIVPLLVLTGLVLLVELHLSPYIRELARNQAVNAASNAIIVGFNVRPDAAARDSAARNHVDMRMYRVIYDAIDEIEAAMKGMLAPKFREAIIGHAEIRQTYKVSSVGTVAGCYVTDGKIQRACDVRIVRDGIVVHEGHLASLQRFKDSVKEVAQGYECGLSFEKYNDIKVGDIVEAYVMEQIEQ